MGNAGSFNGMIKHAIATGMAQASISDVEARLKDAETAHQALSKRWGEMTGSPQVAAYRAN